MPRGRPAQPKLPDGTMPEALAGIPKCPPTLKGVARKAWGMLIDRHGPTGLLQMADWLLIERYCRAVARYVAACDKCDEQGEVLGEGRNTFQNPQAHVRNAAADEMQKLEAVLGIGPLNRQRFKVKPQSDGKSKVPTRDRSKGPPPPSGKFGVVG